MVARWLQAKLAKQRKLKRLAPKWYPSQGVDHNSIRAYDAFNNKQRVASVQGRRENVLPVLNNTFTQEIPKTKTPLRGSYTYYKEHIKNGRLIKTEIFGPDAADICDSKEFHPHPNKKAIEASLAEREKTRLIKERITLITTLRCVWQGKAHQGVTTFNATVLKKAPGFSLTLYFAGTEVIVVQEAQGTRWISRTYDDLDDARFRAENFGISWIIEEKIEVT